MIVVKRKLFNSSRMEKEGRYDEGIWESGLSC